MTTNELKPCPFCGGEAEIQVAEYTSFVDGYAVRCGSCALTFGAYGRIGETYCWSCCFETEAEAIEAWNTRAERTCTFSVYQTGDDHYPTCSACGYEAAREECEDYVGVVYYEKRYCPNCGAKVVQE